MIYILTVESLIEDVQWYYRVKFADMSRLEQSGKLEHFLLDRYPLDVRAAAFLATLMVGEWISKHLALLARRKWLGEGWVGHALVHALCEKAMAYPMFEVTDLMGCSTEEIFNAARNHLKLN